MRKTLIAFLLCSAVGPACAQTPGGFAGADPTGAADSTAAINGLIANAIANGDSTVTLQPGATYRVSQTGKAPPHPGLTGWDLLIKGASNFTLDCNGSTILADGNNVPGSARPWSTAISIQDTTGKVTLRNCVIGMETPYFVQGTMTGKTSTSATFTLTAGSIPPEWTAIQQLDEYAHTFPDTLNGQPVYKTTAMVFSGPCAGAKPCNRPLTPNGGGSYTITGMTPAETAKINTSPGNTYVIERANFGFDGVDAYNTGDLVFDNVVINLAGIGFNTLQTGAVSVINGSGSRVAPGAASGLRTINGSVFGYARGPLMFRDGVYDNEGDDAINVWSANSKVIAQTSPNNVTVALPYPFIPWKTGDELELLGADGGIAWSGDITGPVAVAGRQMSFSVSSPLPPTTAPGLYMGDRSELGPWVAENNEISYIRGNAITGNGRKIKIAGNKISYVTNGIYLVSTMNYFQQGPIPQNVDISDNTLYATNYQPATIASILVDAFALKGSPDAPNSTISHVTIRGNTCRLTASNCVFVGAAENVEVSGNTCDRWNQHNTMNWDGLGDNCIAGANISNFRSASNCYHTAGGATPGRRATLGGRVVNADMEEARSAP